MPYRDEAPVYLLFEHQSTPEPLMPFRLLRYMLRIWGAGTLPTPTPIGSHLIPSVLYHGAEAWTAPLAFEELIDLPPDLEAPRPSSPTSAACSTTCPASPTPSSRPAR
ncbi:MAG: Rpn family recombination-promoting nuclease/putative transposase [bacterium]